MTWDDDLEPEQPDTFYRFERPGSEARIKRDGMRPVELRDDINVLGNGVYMYGFDPSHMLIDGAGELYEIDGSDLEEIVPDYEIDGAWFYPRTIPPDKIKRVA